LKYWLPVRDEDAAICTARNLESRMLVNARISACVAPDRIRHAGGQWNARIVKMAGGRNVFGVAGRIPRG